VAKIAPLVLVDSVIMIDHFNGMPAATEYLSDMQGKLAISIITRAEVLTGFEGKDWQLARCRSRGNTTAPKSLEDTRCFASRTCGVSQIKLATRDTDDFPPKRYCFVIVP